MKHHISDLSITLNCSNAKWHWVITDDEDHHVDHGWRSDYMDAAAEAQMALDEALAKDVE